MDTIKQAVGKVFSGNWIVFMGMLFALLVSGGIFMGNYYPVIVPFGLLALYVVLFQSRLLYPIIAFLTPLSVQLIEFFPNLPIDFYLPTEPVLLLLTLVSLLYIILGNTLSNKFIHHPLSYLIMAYFVWMIFTSITSTHMVVSIKYVLVRMWFIVPMYFAFRYWNDKNYIELIIKSYVLGLILVTIYTIFRHSTYGFFDKQAVYFVMSPFYRDHTSYGAALAMILPFVLAFIYNTFRSKPLISYIYIIVFAWLVLATVLSYTRAAWISLLGAGALFVFMWMRVHVKYLIVAAAITLFLAFIFWPEISMRLEKNKQDSSNELNEHVQSVTNIATDVSNLERINRWKSAYRMILERPLVGFGPGTYQFEYAGYQRSFDMTWVSTNFGDVGNAHSEYIGAAAEMGIPGALIFGGIVIVGLLTGYRVVTRTKGQKRVLAIAMILSLSTYYLHAFLNNFLDMDKIAILFWFAHGWLVYHDVEVADR